MAVVVIKKYGNRRLYDTGDSKYVTLDELAVRIRAGVDVRVVDAQTAEDLTQATLTQIVLETGHAAKFLPVQLLMQMIRLSDDSLAEFFSRYVTGALDVYLQAKRGVNALSAYNPLTQIPGAATDALARLLGLAGGFPPGYGYAAPGYAPVQPAPGFTPAPPPGFVPAPPPASATDREPTGGPDAAPTAGDRSDVAAMRRELDELKAAIREGFARQAEAPATVTPIGTKKRKP